MRFLARAKRQSPKPMQNTTTVDDVRWRFRTRGGATVTVKLRATDAVWRCLGCDEHGDSSHEWNANRKANEHASSCWSMPKPKVSR